MMRLPQPLRCLQQIVGTLLPTPAAAYLFCICLVAFSYQFHRFGFWNVNSRLALTYSVVEKGALTIDQYVNHPHYATLDRAFYNGHYYSDKIIGLSMLGVPVYWALEKFCSLAGKDPKPLLSRYVLTVIIVSVSASLFAAYFFRLLLLLGQRPATACLATLLMAFGTMLFPFASLFYPYLPALLFLFAALFHLLDWSARGVLNERPSSLLGVLLGLSMLCEYTMLLPCLGCAILFAVSSRRGRKICAFAVACALPLSLFALYNAVCFGAPFSLPYNHLEQPEFRAGMSQGLMGVGRFQWYVVWLILVDPYRGIFFYSPFLLLGFVGLCRAVLLGRSRGRFLASFAIVVVVYYIWLNGSYYMWWGGGTPLARHLIPMLPFLGLGFAWYPRKGRQLLMVLGAVSVMLIGVISVVDPHYEETYANEVLYQPWKTRAESGEPFTGPFWRHSLPDFLEGRVSMNWFNHSSTPVAGRWWTLAPLLLIEAFLLYRLRRSVCRDCTRQNVTAPQNSINER